MGKRCENGSCSHTLGAVAPAVTVRSLEVRYRGAVALTDVDLDVAEGSTLAVIGPNGSGKSTLLKSIAGVVDPTAGSVALGRGVAPALVLQSTDVDRHVPISVRDTVRMARYATLGLFRRFGPADSAAVDGAMRRLAVEHLADRQLHELSGGQRQRVLVAQGLAQGAPVLLLDEPVNGLDLRSQALILDVVESERAGGRAVVMTTHDLGEARRCDHVLLLDTAPIAWGTPAEVLCEEHLQSAFGGRFQRLGDDLVLDDPHHHDHELDVPWHR